MDKKQQEYFDFMMSKPSGGIGGEGCLTTIIGVVIILFIAAIIGCFMD